MNFKFACNMVCLPVLLLAASSVQAFPNKPIQIVVPFGAGSITDVVARSVAEKMREGLGQTVIVENKPGVGGIIGAAYVARANPDGYTILLGSNSTNSINQSLFKQLPYSPEKDLIPISLAGEIPAVLVTPGQHQVNNMKELIALARQRPSTLSFGIGNTTNRVAGEMLQKEGKFAGVIVPYRGEPYGMTDLLGRQIDFMFVNLPVAYPHIVSGKIKAIALTGNERVSALPSIPTVSETVPAFSMPNGWLAFFAPAGTDKAVIDRLNHEIVLALKDPAVVKRLEGTGGYIVKSSSPAALGERVSKDAERWGQLIKDAGIALE